MNNIKQSQPSQAVIEQAKLMPGGYVYEIDNSFGPFDDESHIPPHAIIGAWKVDDQGYITGGFIPNENYIEPPIPGLPAGVKVILPS